MRSWRLLAVVLLGCGPDSGVGGRWQGASEAGASPASVAFTLRVVGHNVRGWGVAHTDGLAFPIAVFGKTSHDSITLKLAPWRSGVVDIESAQISGALNAKGQITGTLRTDGGLGIGPVTSITLTRPAP